MNTGTERRRDPRIPVGWPVVLMAPQGAIKGKTANISVSGLALLLFSEMPEFGEEFQVSLKSPKNDEISVTCEKVWSDKIIFDGSAYFGIGVRFTNISSSDRQIIASEVAEYYPI